MVLFIVKDICVLISLPALVIVLSNAQRAWPIIAAIFATVALLLDIVSSLLVLALPGFERAMEAAPVSARTAYVVVADFLFRYIWQLETPFIVALLGLAVVLFGITARRAALPWFVSYSGIILGAVALIAGLAGRIEPVLFIAVWYIAIGVQLLRIAKHA
jgi:hypothetical protein